MQAKKMQQLIHRALVDAKGQDIRVLDVRKVAGFTDYMVIASGTSSRHVATLAEKVVDKLRAEGLRPIGLEGKEFGEWVLIDFGDVVTHVMHPHTRDFYNLEKLWAEIQPEAPAKPPTGVKTKRAKTRKAPRKKSRSKAPTRKPRR
ncbi:MAG: ribosome silencing factor [Candidatus Muproteobacteria bacterium RBG_16_64_11]|uniref:Ribosomal silencing factor RsfS n=1 Tax=Candidatus Muproteobacteria bacterium RBG_16_64_11 TaxID=1817758 RepID=A0A1F6TDG5_9PROT|nr:MAG: ribosome silencing factor [Candidatus Muproteobacteria bacterium RBG_16_64_11]